MQYNDYELVSLAQELNEHAINLLHEKYHELIFNMSKKAFNYLNRTGLELSDVIQEATIGFEEAIKDYNQDDKASFLTFATLCVDRQINTLIVKQNRKKNKILNEAITMDLEDNLNLLGVLTDGNTPETELFCEEEANELYSKIKQCLTSFEDNVFELRLQGLDYKEITELLEIQSKDTYNAIDRIKRKVTKILED